MSVSMPHTYAAAALRSRLDAATAALKRVQANLKRYRASVLKAACEGRLVPTEAELARKEGRDYKPADKLLQRILRERRARWEADTLAKLQASGKSPKDDHWKQKYKAPSAPDTANLPPLPEGWC
jgi:type I restriction enzyme S subunit